MTKTFIQWTMLILTVSLTINLSAQEKVKNYPYNENFQTTFAPGPYFLPHWKANNMKEGVMGQYKEGYNSCLYMIPEGEEMPTMAMLYLDLSGKNHTYLAFKVATRKNGLPEDRKRTKLSVSISTNGGLTFGYGKKIGPEMGFENVTTGFTTYYYPFPPVATNQSNVVIRFQGKAGGGPHLASKLIIDDVRVAQAWSDIFPPFITGEVSPKDLQNIQINFSEPLDPVKASNVKNYIFSIPLDNDFREVVNYSTYIPIVQSAYLLNNGYSLLLKLAKPMEQGDYYSLTMNNISDLNGNSTTLLVDELVHNIPKPGELIITEVLFADPSAAHPMEKLQFVEIYNPTYKPVPLGGLRIKGAIAAHNMPNIRLAPGSFWVITRNQDSFKSTFGFHAWEWKGSWIQYDESHEGEPIETQQLFIQTTDHHGAPYVDHVVFNLGASPWNALNRPGYSMEVCDISSPNDAATNWVLADDSDAYDYVFGSNKYTVHATPGRARPEPYSCSPAYTKAANQEGEGINDETFQKEEFLQVTPNPIWNEVTVSIHPDFGNIRRIEIFGINGERLHFIDNIDQPVHSFTPGRLPNGFYVLRAHTQMGILSKKIIIQ